MFKRSSNIKNSGWNLANILLYPVAFLAVTPFFINQLGEESFGVWMLVNSYVYIAVHILSFGLGNSITAYVAEALGKKLNTKLHAYVNSATKLIVWISLGTIGFALLWVVLNALGIHLFELDLDTILVIATFVITVKFWELLYQNILKGFERYDLASFWNIISKILVLGAQVGLVLMGFGLMEIFISNLILNLVMVIFQAVVSYRLLPGYRFRLVSNEERKDLYHFGFWTWLQTIVQVLAYQIDRFIIAAFLGPVIAGYYILASTIANHMHMAFMAVVSWLFPKIARKKESNESDIKLYFHTLRGFSLGSSLLVIFVTYLLYEPVFTLWLGADKFAKMGDYFALFLMFEAFLIMTVVPLLFLNGMKMLKFITSLEFMYKIGAIVGMIIAFWISPKAESLILGQVIALGILIPMEYFFINQRLLKESAWQETLITVLPSLLIALLIWIDSPIYTLLMFIAAVLIFVLYFMPSKRFKKNLLLE